MRGGGKGGRRKAGTHTKEDTSKTTLYLHARKGHRVAVAGEQGGDLEASSMMASDLAGRQQQWWLYCGGLWTELL